MTDQDSSLARIEERLDHIAGQLDELRPLLLERSGDLRRMERFERDLDNIGVKFRAGAERIGKIEERQDAAEKRRARETGIVIGVLGVLQALWALAGDAIKAALLGVGR